MAQIHCKTLSVHRKGREVIRDFNLSVEHECVVVEGIESGTLLEVISGWRKPRAGRVEVGASRVARLPFEKLPVYWTGADWLSFCGDGNGEVSALLGTAGIRLNKIIRNLDPRETQFLSTVSTLLSNVQVYLLYDPFSGMTENEAKAVADLFQKRALEGAAVLLAFEHYGWPFKLRKVSL